MKAKYAERTSCRICGSGELHPFLDFGDLPPTNSFKQSPDEEVETFPLVVTYCTSCTHVQVKYTVDREYLFTDYPYLSSASDSIPDRFVEYAGEVERRHASSGDLVVDIGSNDGTLLQAFGDDVRTVGVEPAGNVAEIAAERGVETVTTLFGSETAAELREERGPASVILANNVLGHVDDLHDLMRGVRRLLDDQGVFVVEVPYLVDLVHYVEFDTMFHEHVSYFSVTALIELVEQFDLRVTNVERFDVHGGSIRATIEPRSRADPDPSVDALPKLETALGFDREETFERFAGAVERKRETIRTLLSEVAGPDVSIVGYGAPSKGNVLLNYCGIGTETLEYVVDTTPTKQRTYTPGTDVPVYPPERFREDDPEFALLLAWNYEETILEKEAEYRRDGGQFIVPVPDVDVV